MKVLIVGANGKVGTLLCGKMWAANGFSPVALIRDARQQTKFTALGVPSAVGDLEKGLQVSFEKDRFPLYWLNLDEIGFPRGRYFSRDRPLQIPIQIQ